MMSPNRIAKAGGIGRRSTAVAPDLRDVLELLFLELHHARLSRNARVP